MTNHAVLLPCYCARFPNFDVEEEITTTASMKATRNLRLSFHENQLKKSTEKLAVKLRFSSSSFASCCALFPASRENALETPTDTFNLQLVQNEAKAKHCNFHFMLSEFLLLLINPCKERETHQRS